MLSDLARVLYDESAILARLDELAAAITRDYDQKELTVVAVLNGSFMFLADLLRRIPCPLRVDCISVASYHGATESSGRVTFDQLTPPDVCDRHVLILDDILDSGRTLDAILRRLESEGARSLRTCVLLRKNKSRAKPVDADYVGFDIADEFVVGYGLDFQEKYRNLPCIGVLHPRIVEAALAAAP
jgi:hypoxanthine phosphoribosyltransferase